LEKRKKLARNRLGNAKILHTNHKISKAINDRIGKLINIVKNYQIPKVSKLNNNPKISMPKNKLNLMNKMIINCLRSKNKTQIKNKNNIRIKNNMRIKNNIRIKNKLIKNKLIKNKLIKNK
jgi:hypothetical protein